MILFFVVVAIVLATSAFCSTAEASLLSVSRMRLEARAETSHRARMVLRLKDRADRPVVAILILNTIANTGGAAFAGYEYQRIFAGMHLALFTIGFTIAVLVVGELIPKVVGVRHAESVILVLAVPVEIVSFLMWPATMLIERTMRFVGASRSQHGAISIEDLRAVARLAARYKTLGREEHMIIESAARLPRVQVDQIMIHRDDIVRLSLEDGDAVNLGKARQSMHTRVLLCRDEIDEVVGFVNVKELLWRMVEEPEDGKPGRVRRLLLDVARDPLDVAPETDVVQLLRLFSKTHDHIAIVRDRAEHVVGMVTLEDVVEEILGEIDDEYDRSPTQAETLRPGVYRFGGGTPWTVVAETLKLPVQDHVELDLDGRFDMNDLAADRLRGQLRTGGVFSIGKWRFKVLRMRRGKVLQVDVKLLGQPSAEGILEESTVREGV